MIAADKNRSGLTIQKMNLDRNGKGNGERLVPES